MWQRFTERARKAVFYAQEEAQRFGHGYVSSEHLLLGALREDDSLSCQVLTQTGVRPETVKSKVLSGLDRGESRVSSDMTLTPQAKRTIDLAYDEARQLGNNYIGTEHLLLGIIRDNLTGAGRIMANLGVTLEEAHRVTLEIQAAGRPKKSDEGPATEGFQDRHGPELKAVYWHAEGRAKEYGAGYVATEHLLLGILAEPANVGSRALAVLNVHPNQLVSAIEPCLYRESFEHRGMMFTPRARAVLGAAVELAAEESKVVGPRPAHSGHLLIALARDGEGLAGRTLVAQGLTVEALERAVAQVAKD